MRMKQEQVTLRCKDGQEAVVFTTYIYDAREPSYEINIEDSYIGGDYRGFFGRIKRAWKAFWDKPVVYTGIYCDDKNKMRKFLYDCINLITEDDIQQIKTMYDQMRGNTDIDDSVTSNEELMKEGKW